MNRPENRQRPAKRRRIHFSQHQEWSEGLTNLMQFGLTMVGCIALCMFTGLKIDRWLGVKGIFTVIFTIFGIIGGGVVVYRQIEETLAPDAMPNDPPKIAKDDSSKDGSDTSS